MSPNSRAKIALRTFSSTNCAMPENRNAGWVADIEFVFAECVRVQKAISDAVKNNPASLKDLPKEDMMTPLANLLRLSRTSCGAMVGRLTRTR
jgi:hypothetical protein